MAVGRRVVTGRIELSFSPALHCATAGLWREHGQIGNYRTPGVGEAATAAIANKSHHDIVINNGKYKCNSVIMGKFPRHPSIGRAVILIKSYCPWVWQETAHRKIYKQMKNNVLVSTACPCACAGY